MQGDMAVFNVQAQTVPSISLYVQSKQADQAQYQREREVEAQRRMKTTCRQTELLPSDVLDSPI